MRAEPEGFRPKGGLSLADVLRRVDQDGHLAERRRREIVSSLRKLATMIEKPLERISADPVSLRSQTKRLTAAKGGISEVRFRNIKSNLSAALRVAGVVATNRLAPFTPEWEALWDRVTDDRIRWNLSRLGHFCSANGIMPDAVDDAVIAAVHKALIEEGQLRDPDLIRLTTVRYWNRAVELVPGWPQTQLTPPPRKRLPWTIPFDQFPEPFQKDVAAWEARLRNTNPLITDAPPRPLSPQTVSHLLFKVRMIASALVRVGHPIERITSLAYLVDLQNFRAGIGFLLDRHGGPKESIHNVAMAIKAIAVHFVKVPADQHNELKAICKRLDLEVDGVRERNRERLLQFDDDDNLAALLHLPSELVEVAVKLDNRKPLEAARLVQVAVGVEILLFTALRIGNLSSINLDQHLKWARTRDGEVLHISTPGPRVKNKTPLHHELSGAAIQLVKLYLERYRPRLTKPDNPWMFPGRFGGYRGSSGFSDRIKEVIRRHAGVEINAHLFRHLANKMHAMQHPGDHVTLAHTLGDTLETVMSTYAIFDRARSIRHYQSSVFALRAAHKVHRPVRRPRKPSPKPDSPGEAGPQSPRPSRRR